MMALGPLLAATLSDQARMLSEELASDTGTRPVATQSSIAMGVLEESFVRRFLIGIVDKRLLESLHLSDGRELTIIDRGQPYAYRWQSVYGRAETWIPLADITAVDWDWGTGEAATSPVTAGASRPARAVGSCSGSSRFIPT